MKQEDCSKLDTRHNSEWAWHKRKYSDFTEKVNLDLKFFLAGASIFICPDKPKEGRSHNMGQTLD